MWISIDIEDQKGDNFPYFKKKFYFFIFLFLVIFFSWILEVNFFMNLNLQEPVLCCSNLYRYKMDYFLFGSDIHRIIILFYCTYLGIIISTYLRKRIMLLFLSIFFLYLSYISIVYFFSAYIYELPTHQCPYCILSKEYNFIGYFIYASLILATYYAFYGVILTLNITYKIIVAYSVFIALVSLKYIYYLIHTLFL